MQIKAAIFDVDGTLLDSLGIWEEADEEYLSRRGITPEEGLGRILYPMTVEEASAYIREHYPVEQTIEEIAKGVLEIVREFYEQKAPLKPGAEALLRKLKAQDISMAVATTGERMLVEAAFERLGIREFFQGIYTCTETGAGKDRPKIYQLAAEALQARPEEVLVFEDALYAIRTAAKAGFVTVGVEDPYNAPDKEAIRETADYYTEELAEFPKFWEW